MTDTSNGFINQEYIKDITVAEEDILNKLVTFSDDDSSCSFESEEEKLFTPPIEANNALNSTVDIDWEYWSNVISNYHHFSSNQLENLSLQIKYGIPSTLRGTIWPILATSKNKSIDLNHLQSQYIDLLKQDSVYEKAITRDLHRTFPHHPFFQSPVGQEALFNLAKAYSILDPEVGYCQGLSFVAGPLLLNMPEEEAFCILVQLMQNYDIRDHYTPQLDLLRQRLYQFDGLLQDYLPHIHRHFIEQGVRSNMYASQWFLTLFAYKFPLDVVYQIYDILFVEGVNCLFRLGLALLAKNQSTLLSLEFDALVLYLKDDTLLAAYGQSITDLTTESLTIQISQRRLDQLAKLYQIETAKADTEASRIETLRKQNKRLTEHYRQLESNHTQLVQEHALVAQELVTNKREWTRVSDENDALVHQASELKKVLKVIPDQIEKRVQSEMEVLCLKNQYLNQRNAQLQDQLADLESLAVEMKLKYAQSESDREILNQKLNDLKKWMNSI